MREAKAPWDDALNDLDPLARSDTKSQRAEAARRNAGIERRLALHAGPEEAAARLKDAERLDRVASDLMRPISAPVVSCGEVTGASGENGPARQIVNTLSNPDQAAIDASIARTDLLFSASPDIVPLAVDAAASVKADNSLEKMLVHQLSLIHMLAMKTGSRALEFENRRGEFGEGFKQTDSVELARLAQVAGRLTSTFQDGLLTLQRIGNGGSQTMTIRHVNVHAGGQALIGNVKPGARCGSKLERGKPK
jgi:hypothetical protein